MRNFVVSFDAAANLNNIGYKSQNEANELDTYRSAWQSAFESLVRLAKIDADYYDTVEGSLDEYENCTRTDLGDEEPTFEGHLWQSVCDCVFFDDVDGRWYSCIDEEMEEEVEAIKRLYEKVLVNQ